MSLQFQYYKCSRQYKYSRLIRVLYPLSPQNKSGCLLSDKSGEIPPSVFFSSLLSAGSYNISTCQINAIFWA